MSHRTEAEDFALRVAVSTRELAVSRSLLRSGTRCRGTWRGCRFGDESGARFLGCRRRRLMI